MRPDRRSARGGTQARRSIVVPIFTPTELSPIDLPIAGPIVDEPAPPGASDDLSQCMGMPALPIQYQGDVIDAQRADRAPRVLGRAPEPRYPSSLREAGIQGRVVAEFVVDTLGRPELEGLRLDAPQTLFAESVRAVLPRYHFTAGEANGHKVRTRVQLPFDFTLTR
jgi:protein TonB